MTAARKRLLLLWDVDHTLIENSGVSKATYALAFERLTGTRPAVQPATDGRTDREIMRNLFAANSVDLPITQENRLGDALIDAGRSLVDDLFARGYVLPGVPETLGRLGHYPAIVQSVLTGNIRPNAENKVRLLGNSASFLDLEVGGYGSDDVVRARLVGIARSKAEQRYGMTLDRSSTVLIGDTERDVAAARDGGAKIVAIATGSTSEYELQQAGADAVLPDLTDSGVLLQALAEMIGWEVFAAMSS